MCLPTILWTESLQFSQEDKALRKELVGSGGYVFTSVISMVVTIQKKKKKKRKTKQKAEKEKEKEKSFNKGHTKGVKVHFYFSGSLCAISASRQCTSMFIYFGK